MKKFMLCLFAAFALMASARTMTPSDNSFPNCFPCDMNQGN
jgi:hypothetical protein